LHSPVLVLKVSSNNIDIHSAFEKHTPPNTLFSEFLSNNTTMRGDITFDFVVGVEEIMK